MSSPRCRIAIRSQMSCMSASRCPESTIVLPCSRSSRIRCLISEVPIGSRPEVGSSSRISSGLLIRAWASPMRRCMPLEYSRSWRCLAAVSPTMSINRLDPLVALGRGDLEQTSIKLKRLFGVQELVKVRLLGKVADPLVLGDVGRRLVEDQGLALGREQQAEQQLDRRGLSRAVGSEQSEDFAAMDLKVEGLERLDLGAAPEIAVDLGQVPGLDDDFMTHYTGAFYS